MGKVKSVKKGSQSALTQRPQKTPANSVNALEADLASLDESKRQKACMLLADLYSFNISNKISLETLTSSNILSKLSMRLVDSSEKVRVEGASALKNLSESKDSAIIKRLISLGILRSAVSLCVETLSATSHTVTSVAFAESLLHTLANAISCNSGAINEVLSTNADFVSGLFGMINTNTPADIVSAVANLLIIVTGHCPSATVMGGDATSTALQTRMEQVWSFVEALNGMKSASAQEIAALKLFSLQSNSTTTVQPNHADESHEQRAFQLTVLMVECLEVVLNVYTHAPHSLQLADVCRVNRALLLLTLELHTSLNGIEVASPSAHNAQGGAKERHNSTVSMDTEESGTESASQQSGIKKGSAQEDVDPVAVANMKRLGLCKTLAGVLAGMLELLSGDSDASSTTTTVINAADLQQKSAIIARLLWDQQTYATLLQCYNATWYFLAASTTPTLVNAAGADRGAPPVNGAGTEAGEGNVVSGKNEEMVNAIAITPTVIEGLDCCDQLVSTLGLVFGLLAAHGATQMRESGLVDVPLSLQLLQPLLDLVTTTSPVTEGSSTGWNAPYFVDQGVTENGFRRSLLSAAAALFDFLTLVIKGSTTASVNLPDAAVVLNDDVVKDAALILVKGSSYPNVEIAVPAVLAMAALGQRDFKLQEASAGQHKLVPTKINWLLTNALLRRVADPSAYACDTAQQDKQLRLLEGSMQLMDSCFNAIIDLHTSDDLELLKNYHSLQCAAKLQERGDHFANKLGSTAAKKLDGSDLEKFSETLENLESFIRYKAGFQK